MTSNELINYFLQNPPFEITDIAKYTEMLKFVSDFTLIELSENDALLDEVLFTTEDVPGVQDVVSEGTVILDLQTIDDTFMEIVALQTTDTFAESIAFACTSTGSWNVSYGVSANAIAKAMDESSVISYLAIKDSIYIIDEWFRSKMKKIIYRGSEIKVKPLTEYYMLYRKYKTLADLNPSDMKVFKELFEINLQLQIYQSDTFAAEGGLRSVSLSGLSVSFNVPDASTVVGTLRKTKSRILSKGALDYSEGTLGII